MVNQQRNPRLVVINNLGCASGGSFVHSRLDDQARDFCLATAAGSVVGYWIHRFQSMPFNTTVRIMTYPAGGCPQRAGAARNPAMAPISSGTWG
jgi:hypothetical protein